MGLLLTGCSLLPGHADGPPVVTELLTDVSQSMADPTVQTRLIDDVHQVAEATARRGGILLGDLVTSNPTDDSATPISQDFKPSEDVKGNEQYEQPERQRKVEAAMAQVKNALVTAQHQGTDILTGCLVAQRVLARYSSVKRRELVIFSDMLQHSAAYDFYSVNFDDAHNQELLAALKEKHALPNLTGVHVYVSGAGIDPTQQISAERNLAVARFWSAYFKMAGADLQPGNYSARLPAFP